uniref:Uncharacterized protein n=1 Tax=Opuntia streptacantha TaxID=393608 RepID=A0A7C8Z8G7_OPUST
MAYGGGRWQLAAAEYGGRRQMVATGGRTRPKTEDTGEAEEEGQRTAATAGRRRVQRRLPAVHLGGRRVPAPVIEGGGRRQRKKKRARGGFTVHGKQRRQGKAEKSLV